MKKSPSGLFCFGVDGGIEPSLTESQSAVLPLHYEHRSGQCLVWVARFERAASAFQGRPSTGLTIHPEIIGRGRALVFIVARSVSQLFVFATVAA